MSKARRIVITHVYENDAYYDDKDKVIGMTGSFVPSASECNPKGYFAGDFTPDKKSDVFEESDVAIFFGIRYKRI